MTVIAIAGDAGSGKSMAFEHTVDYLLRLNMDEITERIQAGGGAGVVERGTGNGTRTWTGRETGKGMTINSPMLQLPLAPFNTNVEHNIFNFEGDILSSIHNSDYEFGHNFRSKMESAKILLDAFGTAKTVNNQNATRYGKYLNLYYKGRKSDKKDLKFCGDGKFDFKQYILGEGIGAEGGRGRGRGSGRWRGERVDQDLVGGQYSIYLLQTHTVTERNRGRGNRNFDVFYRLVSGLRTFHSGKLGTS